MDAAEGGPRGHARRFGDRVTTQRCAAWTTRAEPPPAAVTRWPRFHVERSSVAIGGWDHTFLATDPGYGRVHVRTSPVQQRCGPVLAPRPSGPPRARPRRSHRGRTGSSGVHRRDGRPPRSARPRCVPCPGRLVEPGGRAGTSSGRTGVVHRRCTDAQRAASISGRSAHPFAPFLRPPPGSTTTVAGAPDAIGRSGVGARPTSRSTWNARMRTTAITHLRRPIPTVDGPRRVARFGHAGTSVHRGRRRPRTRSGSVDRRTTSSCRRGRLARIRTPRWGACCASGTSRPSSAGLELRAARRPCLLACRASHGIRDPRQGQSRPRVPRGTPGWLPGAVPSSCPARSRSTWNRTGPPMPPIARAAARERRHRAPLPPPGRSRRSPSASGSSASAVPASPGWSRSCPAPAAPGRRGTVKFAPAPRTTGSLDI